MDDNCLAHRGDVGEDQQENKIMIESLGLAHRGDVGEDQRPAVHDQKRARLAHRGDVGEDQHGTSIRKRGQA